ncbi:Cro/Cl family transcriptional regulator [Pararhizobium polonicum]|uniref:Cro/Cl family transcriptional regulator n=1 Tax=Pararhizobium polonicum TaxID=1612624 RepID=A0A1C7P0B2_9HYPH|nr:Cro/Cl family transcriptional regulator [Pararhizobium polonicum]
MDAFTENLRFACATRPSISQICREIGINRQQFNRYISGVARPSAHNLSRIANFFALASVDFDLASSAFQARLTRPDRRMVDGGQLLEGLPGDLPALRRHLGYFQTYHLSPSWPGLIVCSCARLLEENGSVHIKSIERIHDASREIRQYSKYVGLAAFWRNRIFITERSISRQPMMSQTILIPFEVHQRVYLRGVTMGVSWRKENLPYASRVIWRHLGTNPDKRQVLSRCGVLPVNARQLPATVRSYLEAPPFNILSVPENF